MTFQTIAPAELARWTRAAPFWLSYLLPALLFFSATQGGWWILLVPFATWYLFSALDAVLGLDQNNADTGALEDDLAWYRRGVVFWAPVQFATLFTMIWYVPRAAHLSGLEAVVLFFGVGVITGTIGINYSHELMHQKSKLERWCADFLLAMVLYSHFRSEHLLVHHRYVGTPRDPVTALYDEGFFRYFPRVLRQCFVSAFNAEAAKLGKKNLPWTHPSNPFWSYAYLQGGLLLLAVALSGWAGLVLFLIQAATAIWQLELVNYVEHYGLTRKHLGAGKYEHVRPHHSWNAAHKASNWLLINLQRHSDHHYKPDRRFPILQTYSASKAPQLPYGYPVMTVAAMFPPLWRRIMNPRVDQWRARHYPEVATWHPYNKASHPAPR